MRWSCQIVAKVVTVFAFIAFAGVIEVKGQTLQIDSNTADWIEGIVDFVKWEKDSSNRVVTIGVLNAPEIATYLEKRIRARTTDPLIYVVRIEDIDEIRNLDVLFVGPGNQKRWSAIVQICESNQILSMGNQDGFFESGGCIEFSVQKNRIIFYANHESLEKSEIEIRAQLLELAKNHEP